MTGPFLALAASLSWGVGDFLAGLSSRKLQLLTVLVISQAAGLTSLAVLVAVRGSGPPEARYLLYAALAGIAGAIGLAALYRGLAVGSMSVVAPISATAAVIPVVAGLITGERPSGAQGAGIALALAGVVLASRERRANGAAAASRRESASHSSRRWRSAFSSSRSAPRATGTPSGRRSPCGEPRSHCSRSRRLS